jgi:hypothetical protein
MAKTSNIDEKKAAASLLERDIEGGVNSVSDKSEETEDNEEVKKITLGKAKSVPTQTAAGESGWKLVSLNGLPSNGLLYPENLEILIRSAKTKEIRHWSTIDEHDPLDVSEKIGFVLNSCARLNVKGKVMNLNMADLLDIDKFHILFKIHKITFPNSENKLFAKMRCKKCKNISSIRVTDSNLKGFEYPEELMEWYSDEYKCFVINSQKLNEKFTLHLPTIGSSKIISDYLNTCHVRGMEKDEAFDKIVPYLIDNWRTVTVNDVLNLRSESNRWSENKFLFLHKATELLSKGSKNRALGICESCKTKIDSSIFLGGSFTVKDIFIISTRLRDLI